MTEIEFERARGGGDGAKEDRKLVADCDYVALRGCLMEVDELLHQAGKI